MSIKPALTAEEWAEELERAEVWYGEEPGSVTPYSRFADKYSDGGWIERKVEGPTDWHALAALALHGQSWGFTWEDVDLLRDPDFGADGYPQSYHDQRSRLRDLADRIESLLPPRET